MHTMKNFLPSLLTAVLILSSAYLVTGCSNYDGKKLFFTVGCSQCHSFEGKGGSLAPDLSAVTNIRSDEWIRNYIHNPLKMNPQARMPAFKNLSRAKREAIITYLKQ